MPFHFRLPLVIGGSLKTVFPCCFRFAKICFACFQAAYFLPEQAFRRLPRAGQAPAPRAGTVSGCPTIAPAPIVRRNLPPTIAANILVGKWRRSGIDARQAAKNLKNVGYQCPTYELVAHSTFQAAHVAKLSCQAKTQRQPETAPIPFQAAYLIKSSYLFLFFSCII
ncbi:hypothetical protein [Kingella sp. (in: b-proteobacteria)]|uniref:hypothetical protein n=1 Tax=Kingella sp. (in: b-proteobacteria) TaxID=2020713 RepID=UPI0026DBD698|nr:hypothetical protein [Kingella sp. (in: b-proteobacteria)]MDO4658236.1 hypothetical protein [Kingella sp. (in: b-proteobacteria)]